MCHSSEDTEGRTHPVPRNPSKRSASDCPAVTHATICAELSGGRCRVMDTVTGPVARVSVVLMVGP
ncbi:hypothetical protein GCM10011519_11840 [Marmoricola endophyticus]|uniref:Uncharacterized protein n=1 Tax=Marmoricola endophyticus TaxID=2040280 RepID=A0A917BE96_9ACTN|nr:hypothetical protein GCM10011519_11840 [Marmoricola endophyticus]